VRPYVLLAELEDSRGNWQKAQEYYQKAVQVRPDYPPAANNLAFLMLEHGLNTDVALTLAQTARRGLPESSSTADTLGWAYYNKGAYRSAVELLQEAEKMAPEDPGVHYHLGLTYDKLGDEARARRELERTLQINPKHPRNQEIRQLLSRLSRS
jgi:cellulose synthase operon protein C